MTDILVFDRDAEAYCDRLRTAFADHTFHAAADLSAVEARALSSEILIGLAPLLSDELVARMPDLKWIHALTTGVDNLLSSPAVGADVIITNSHGVHGTQMSELAILMMMSLARRFPQMLEDQRKGNWNRWKQPVLAGRTACIVGLGAIAEALAERCAAFGMRLTGVSDGRLEVPGFSRVYSRARLTEAAGEADFLVVVVPYSARTHHIVDDAVMAAMRPGSFLINIARGGCVDEDALLRHLQSGHLGGAGLDVFSVEPLPADSPLRTLTNVIVTPHIGGMSDTYVQQVLPVVETHLQQFFSGGCDALTGRFARD